MPIKPPDDDSTTAYTRNCSNISFSSAPMARRIQSEVFLRWAQCAIPSLAGKWDGKTLRGSRLNDKAVQLLNAYAVKARLVLT